MKYLSLALLTLLAAPARAETDVSAMIAADGLRATEAHLSALPAPTPTEAFALGGVRFLGGIERALQLRWRVGMGSGELENLGIPILRLPIPENPSPEPFRPEMITEMFAGVVTDMEAAAEGLAAIPDDAEVGLTLDFAGLWFDIDGDGLRSTGEGIAEVTGFVLTNGFGEPLPTVAVRFDTADAAWLAAYAHLMAGVGETVIAIDPTEAIVRVMETGAAMEALAGPPRSDEWFSLANNTEAVDMVAALLFALDGVPDAARAQAAHAHFLEMIAQNRVFWTRVARESDNEAEWIPNKAQTSALGFVFPPETGTMWLAVLSDAERVLKGELLIPYWRLGPGAGLNLARLFEAPPSLDLVGLFQGAALVPYAEAGPRSSLASWRQFEALVGGDAPLFMVMLN
jgi:hypothetical protein